jgi:pyrroloquinoline-quinone synthase
MRSGSTRAIIDAAVAERRLLDHPFYLRWSAGQVSSDELRDYAAQYRHIEQAVPRWLTAIAADCTDSGARTLVERTLADENGDASHPAHLALFEDFAEALDAKAAAPTPATRALLTAIDSLVGDSVVAGLAALAAYEVQSPEVSASKAEGLRRHHGLDGASVAFWDAHAGADIEHADWTVSALDRLEADPQLVGGAASRSAQAWWAFLDEREAARV